MGKLISTKKKKHDSATQVSPTFSALQDKFTRFHHTNPLQTLSGIRHPLGIKHQLCRSHKTDLCMNPPTFFQVNSNTSGEFSNFKPKSTSARVSFPVFPHTPQKLKLPHAICGSGVLIFGGCGSFPELRCDF